MAQVQQKYKQAEKQGISTQLKLLGHCPIKSIAEFEQTRSNRLKILHQMMQSTLQRHKKEYIFNPIKAFTFSNIIAFIDTRERLWVLLDIAAEPICIYDMIKIKVQNLTLFHSSMILSTKQGQLLLSWGSKKGFPERYLQKVTAKNQKFKYLHFFELYEIVREEQEENEKYFFANSQITAFEDSAYSLVEEQKTIIGFPSCKKIKMGVKVSGLSLGKYHCLLWDLNGIVYSWGCKSIALGYGVLPEQEFVEQPRPVDFLPPACKAYAGNNYSLAISTDGMLYEWGVNKMKGKEEQNIFHPRQIKVHNSKLVDLKGNSDKYAVLSLMGELYLWGKDTHKYISQRQQISKEEVKDLLAPTNLGKGLGFVIDFQIEDSFIVLITADKNIQSFSQGRKHYWTNLMNTVQINLKGKPHFRLSQSILYNKSKYQDANSSAFTLRRFNSPIELAFEKKKAKENYIEQSIQPNRTLLQLMKPLQQNHYRSQLQTENNEYINHKTQTVKKAQWRKMHTTIDEFSTQFKRQKQYVQSLVNGIQANKSKSKILRFNKHQKESFKLKEANKINHSYENRLQTVKRKRQVNEKMFIEQVLKKVQNRSYEYRSLKRMQNEQLRKRNKECLVYKLSVQKLFIKAFLIKMLTKPTAEARQIKIASFARYLKIERIQKRIKGLFIKTRINFNMRKLQCNQIFRFFLLTMTFQQYVKRFRLKKYKQLRKKVVGQIFKSVVMQKLKIGLAACNLNIRKVQKFREWISMVRAERKRCLKYIWKVQLLTTMKINSQNQSSAIFYLPKNIEQITFESLYQEKVSLNPLLKLHAFLNHYSIFKIKTTIFQQLFVLTQDQINKNKQKQLKNLGKARKFRIKFSEDQQDKQDRLNLIQTDIYPYSLHYNILLHPKNYDITIPQIMKVSQKWIRQQKKILQKHIDLILRNHEKDYITKRRKYDVDLANYIRRNYDSLAEKRWKYIIEYNKLDRSHEKSKREKQVRRLMGLIGCQKLLDQDCIPQKHSILDEVWKRGDSPIAPNSHIVFGSVQFKKLFKTYYDTVSTKAKQMRRAYL